jgi:hypothetical protein
MTVADKDEGLIARVLGREEKMLSAASPPDALDAFDETLEDQALDAPDLARLAQRLMKERDESDKALLEVCEDVTLVEGKRLAFCWECGARAPDLAELVHDEDCIATSARTRLSPTAKGGV